MRRAGRARRAAVAGAKGAAAGPLNVGGSRRLTDSESHCSVTVAVSVSPTTMTVAEPLRVRSVLQAGPPGLGPGLSMQARGMNN
jgi:hypothetical protein